MSEMLDELARVARNYEVAVSEFKSIRKSLEAQFAKFPDEIAVQIPVDLSTKDKLSAKLTLVIKKVTVSHDLKKDTFKLILATREIDGREAALYSTNVPDYESASVGQIKDIGTDGVLLVINNLLKHSPTTFGEVTRRDPRAKDPQ